jgi:excisionase family DNA binding protein
LLPGPAEPRPSTKSLLTVRDVAARLGVSRATVYKLCEEGALPHIRISNSIRVAPDALEAYLAAAPPDAKGL